MSCIGSPPFSFSAVAISAGATVCTRAISVSV